MYMYHNTEVCLCNDWCHGKAKSIKHYECVCILALVMWHANHIFSAMYYVVMWPVWFYHIFPHHLINGTIFGKKGIEHKMCVLIFATPLVQNISHSKKNLARYYHKCT
jgi:hypothetical protein